MKYEFRWNAWNRDHIEEHGISQDEAENLVRSARRPYPRRLADDKYLVRGKTADGEYLQVIYIFDPVDIIYVIHARPLTDQDKRRYRRELR